MRQLITRYTCDAPDCDDDVEIAGSPDTATLQHLDVSAGLPDGWIELQVTGSSPGGAQDLVHASKPECAAALAEEQVGRAVAVAEQKAKRQEEQREQAEEISEQAQLAAKERADEAAGRVDDGKEEEPASKK